MGNATTIKLILAIAVLLVVSVVSGCSPVTVSSRAEVTVDIAASDAWARSEIAGSNSAAYFIIANDGSRSDRLTGAASDIAGATEIHEVVADGHMMRMQEVEAIEVPAGEIVQLEPGGLHVMFFDLIVDLDPGDSFRLTLYFEDAGEMTVEVEVRDAGHPGHGHGG